MVLCKFFFKLYLLTLLYLVEGLAWWDWLFTWWTDQLLSFSAWHCWLGHLTRKNRPRYDLECVWWDVKPYSAATDDILLLMVCCFWQQSERVALTARNSTLLWWDHQLSTPTAMTPASKNPETLYSRRLSAYLFYFFYTCLLAYLFLLLIFHTDILDYTTLLVMLAVSVCSDVTYFLFWGSSAVLLYQN